MKICFGFLFIATALLLVICTVSHFEGQADLIGKVKEWQTLLATVIAIIGWFVNSYLVRKSEIVKRRLELRLVALKDVIENVLFEMSKGSDAALAKADFKEKLEKVRATIQMYGYRSEIIVYEDFINALNMIQETESEKQLKLKKINDSIPKLSIILESLRSELGLEKIKKRHD